MKMSNRFKINFLLIFAGLFVMMNDLAAQGTDDIREIKRFIKLTSNENAAINDIIAKYICINSRDIDSTSKRQNTDFIEHQLKALRDTLKFIEINKLKVKPYKELPPEKQNIELTKNMIDHVYVVLYKGNTFFTVYILNKRVYSITTLFKGPIGFLMPFCPLDSSGTTL